MLRHFLWFLGIHTTLVLGALLPTNAPVVHNGSPLVSPTSPRILFESNRTGTDQLWIINADGTGERQLTREPAGVSGAQWAADSASLFYSVTSHDSSVLYELWPDSARQRRAIGTFPGRVPEVAPRRDLVIYDVGPWTAAYLMMTDIKQRSARRLSDSAHVVWQGVWAPDGAHMAYTASDKSGLAVWVMNADGSHPHRVSHLTAAEGRAQMPAWSPDSQHLAFQANAPTGRKSTLWVIDIRTGGEREILPHDTNVLDETPSWFSDGDRVAFQSNRSGRMEIWTVKVNGMELRRVTGSAR